MKPDRRTRVPSRRLALLKPDFGVVGGFERVVDRVEETLGNDGHDVTRITIAVDELAHRPFGLDVPEHIWTQAPELFRYLASVEAFAAVDTRRFDAVISTQPPSFAHPHPRHLSLFFHHHRIFYDLEEPYLAAGFSADPELHRRAAARVREVDRPLLADVAWFLAGSEAVRARLARYNGIDRVGLFHAGAPVAAVPSRPLDAGSGRDERGTGAIVSVGRHEFPKRAELFIHAMKYLPHRNGVVVGDGGRKAWAAALDRRLSAPGLDLDRVSAADLWCNTGALDESGPPPTATAAGGGSNVELLGRVDDDVLAGLYRAAPCVVAPALEEDYGLTAVEAMGHGVPVVVCADGGGLASIVHDGVDGLVVEPSGRAIADAVERICSDPDLRASLGAGARAAAGRVTWDRAGDQLRAGLAQVLA